MARPHHILVVDDSSADVQLLQLALLEAGVNHHLHMLPDGESALAYLRRQPPYLTALRPDLILLDINMPRMSGHQVLEEVKADDALKDIPIVILSTSDNPSDVVKSYRLHANSHITKPMDFNSLVAKVDAGINSYWFHTVELPTPD